MHRALNEPELSDATMAVLRKIGRTLGAALGVGPYDDPLLRTERRERRTVGHAAGRTAGHAEGRTEARVEPQREAVLQVLKLRGLPVSAALSRHLAQLQGVSAATVVEAAPVRAIGGAVSGGSRRRRPEIVDPAARSRRGGATDVQANAGTRVDYQIGTMIEIPPGAVTADHVADAADFFSFGTNDLTQIMFGYSRDDATSFSPSTCRNASYRRLRSRYSTGQVSAGGDGGAARPHHQAGADGGHLRQAWGRPVINRVLLPGRHELRLLLPLPHAHIRFAADAVLGTSAQRRSPRILSRHPASLTRISGSPPSCPEEIVVTLVLHCDPIHICLTILSRRTLHLTLIEEVRTLLQRVYLIRTLNVIYIHRQSPLRQQRYYLYLSKRVGSTRIFGDLDYLRRLCVRRSGRKYNVGIVGFLRQH